VPPFLMAAVGAAVEVGAAVVEAVMVETAGLMDGVAVVEVVEVVVWVDVDAPHPVKTRMAITIIARGKNSFLIIAPFVYYPDVF